MYRATTQLRMFLINVKMNSLSSSFYRELNTAWPFEIQY